MDQRERNMKQVPTYGIHPLELKRIKKKIKIYFHPGHITCDLISV